MPSERPTTRKDYLSMIDTGRVARRKSQRGRGNQQHSKTLNKYWAIFKVLSDGATYTLNQRKDIARSLTSQQLQGISHLIKAILKKDIHIEDHALQKLKRHKEELLSFLNSKSRSARIRAVNQRGGFLPLLIPAIASALVPAIKGIAEAIGAKKARDKARRLKRLGQKR